MSPYDEKLELCLSDALPSESCHIISTAQARLYHAPFRQCRWASTGLQGLLVFGKELESEGYWFRILYSSAKKVVWAHNIPKGMKYEKDKPFFHVFAGASRQYGFRFEDDDEADEFFDAVTKNLALLKPVTNKKKRSFLGSRRQTPVVISAPSQGSFVHLAHISLDEKGFVDASENVNPEWLRLFGQSGN
ncbi:PH domain-like protein [Neolentinus lepideus HHB14362 ss-1]|uniref:PH domain-like protein n=1 Tax=Neolentinus lepideus HHB14362 ss-1 TaxID=1314782 RepID=A0A165QDM5_9AGAM|nr:PH domain-like protein [Neolentinus lepideus HHB14362 ss-1]